MLGGEENWAWTTPVIGRPSDDPFGEGDDCLSEGARAKHRIEVSGTEQCCIVDWS